MSDTPKLADESKKLLDSGWAIVLYKNALGDYSGVAISQEKCGPLMEAIAEADPDRDCETDGMAVEDGYCDTSDFEPSQVLYRLTEKVFGNIV